MLRITNFAVLLCVVPINAEFVSADFVFDDFNSTTEISLNGDAASSNGALRLTPAEFLQTGSAWYMTPQRIQDGFSSVFQFQISEVGGMFNDQLGNPGADGFAFVIQNSGVTALGGPGGDMGYGGTDSPGISNSLAIEFDTWFNPASELDDPNSNHISVQTRGVLPNSAHHDFSLGEATVVPDFSDGNVHTVQVFYVPGNLSVYVDDFTSPSLTVATDLSSLLSLTDGESYVGFSAGTYNAWENHDILNWNFSTTIPEPSSLLICSVSGLFLCHQRRRKSKHLD